MDKLIQDVTPPTAAQLQAQTQIHANYVLHVDTDILVTELWARGVTTEQIFGMYYALQAMSDAHSDQAFGSDEAGQHGAAPLTVGDALLNTPAPATKIPVSVAFNKSPF